MAIEQLSFLDEVTGATVLAANVNGQDYKVLPSVLDTYLASLSSTASGDIIQYSAPSATDFSVPLTDTAQNLWLVLTPTTSFADGTLTLPPSTTAIAGQQVSINSTHTVTALVVAGNGATVVGAPTTLAANGFFRLRFEPVLKTWYRVG